MSSSEQTIKIEHKASETSYHDLKSYISQISLSSLDTSIAPVSDIESCKENLVIELGTLNSNSYFEECAPTNFYDANSS